MVTKIKVVLSISLRCQWDIGFSDCAREMSFDYKITRAGPRPTETWRNAATDLGVTSNFASARRLM